MIPTQFNYRQNKQNITKSSSVVIVGCDMLCDMLCDVLFPLWSPVCKEAIFRLESRTLNSRDRSLSFCYSFLVLSLHFDLLVLCNLNTEIFFRLVDHYNNGCTEISVQKLSAIITPIFCYGRGTKIVFQAHLFELGNLQNTGLTEHRPASD